MLQNTLQSYRLKFGYGLGQFAFLTLVWYYFISPTNVGSWLSEQLYNFFVYIFECLNNLKPFTTTELLYSAFSVRNPSSELEM